MENKLKEFENLFTLQSGQIPIFELIINLLIALFIAFLIKETYKTCGRSLSYRGHLAATFTMFILSTTLIITVVKSSLALSLGLVGALSVVRFRTPIKEPEELMYLFFCIGIGLGLGANQRLVTVVGASIILATLWIRYLTQEENDDQKLKLSIYFEGPSKPPVEKINALLKTSCLMVDVRRLDESIDRLELAYDIELKSATDLDELRKALFKLNENLRVTFFDDRGLLQT